MEDKIMTSEESFARYEAIKAEDYPYHEKDQQEWKVFRENPKICKEISKRYTAWRDDKERRENEALKALVPRVGLPCTVYFYTDRHAATVTRIISPCKVAVRDNQVECIDYHAGRYKILPELEGGEYIFTKRSNGKWIMEGHHSKDGVRLLLHYQSHYIDPEF